MCDISQWSRLVFHVHLLCATLKKKKKWSRLMTNCRYSSSLYQLKKKKKHFLYLLLPLLFMAVRGRLWLSSAAVEGAMENRGGTVRQVVGSRSGTYPDVKNSSVCRSVMVGLWAGSACSILLMRADAAGLMCWNVQAKDNQLRHLFTKKPISSKSSHPGDGVIVLLDPIVGVLQAWGFKRRLSH